MDKRVDNIVTEIKKRGITGYKIAEDTTLTEVGVNKVLNGTSKKPRESTLIILENYLHNNYAIDMELNTIKEESKTPPKENDSVWKKLAMTQEMMIEFLQNEIIRLNQKIEEKNK